MNTTWLLAIAGTAALALIAGASSLLRHLRRQKRLIRRVQLSQGVVAPEVDPVGKSLAALWMRVVSMLGQLILRTGLLSSRTLAELQTTLASAGLRGRTGLEIFIGSKIALMLGLPLLLSLGAKRFTLSLLVAAIIPAVGAVVGLLLPDTVVRYRRKNYIKRVERGLPDALDLMVICSQAGLGLTTVIVRVAEEMQSGYQDIGAEFAITANELRLLADSRLALSNLGTRTGIDGLTRLGTTLVQSMQYGTPLSEAMRRLSAEMRNDTLTRFESRAARIGVLLTLPMVVFILPCVFMVVGGPAAVQVFSVSGN